MWLGALYKPPGKVQFVSDMSMIDGFKKEYLHPVTITELVYLAIMQLQEKLVGTSTRPPVLGKGGIGQGVFVPYFTDPYELREDIETTAIGPRYPSVTYTYINTDKKMVSDQTVELTGVWNDSFTVSELRDKALAADRDGDALSALPITTDEARAEIEDSLTRASTYRTATGKLLYNLGTVAIANNVILTLTGK
jgi:hypothetical protein